MPIPKEDSKKCVYKGQTRPTSHALPEIKSGDKGWVKSVPKIIAEANGKPASFYPNSWNGYCFSVDWEDVEIIV